VSPGTTSIAASALPSSFLASSIPGSTGDSDIAERVAALEAQLTQLEQPNLIIKIFEWKFPEHSRLQLSSADADRLSATLGQAE